MSGKEKTIFYDESKVYDLNTCEYFFSYALKNCPDEFKDGPFPSYEAAQRAALRKKGTGLTRWTWIGSIPPGEQFEPVSP
jgi:hypothetical protein